MQYVIEIPENENVRRYRLTNAEPAKELTQPEMTKSMSADEANTDLSIRCSFERESNVTDASELQ
jgi:hypothetical protein